MAETYKNPDTESNFPYFQWIWTTTSVPAASSRSIRWSPVCIPSACSKLTTKPGNWSVTRYFPFNWIEITGKSLEDGSVCLVPAGRNRRDGRPDQEQRPPPEIRRLREQQRHTEEDLPGRVREGGPGLRQRGYPLLGQPRISLLQGQEGRHLQVRYFSGNRPK